MNKQLSYLTSLFGASGSEGDVRQAIYHEIRDHCDRVETDRMGNLIAFKKGAAEAPFTILLSAHMDEVGLMVTHIDSEGYLKFDAVGGLDPRILPGMHVVIGKRKYHGVIGVLAPHLTKGEEKAPAIDDLCIDIGANSKEDAETLVQVGDMVGFDSDYQEFGEGLVRAKALDDRAGCYVLMELLKKDLPFDLYCAFTVMEEVGCLGALTAAYGIHPQYAIILEGTTAGDLHTDGNKTAVCRVGKGPVLSFMDGAAIYDREFYALAVKAAQKAGISLQTKEAVAGGNESGTYQRSWSGCKVLAISVPCRYIHTPVSVASLEDIEDTLSLTRAVLNELL